MSRLIVCIVLMGFAMSFGQQQTIIPNGTITLKSDEEIAFANMRFKDNNVIFNNLTTNKECTYGLDQVKAIEGKAITVDQSQVPVTQAVVKEREDTRFRPNYPDGIYATKEDFINKTPSSSVKIHAKELVGLEKELVSGVIDHCFFYYTDTDSKIKNVFAISYKGHLFFQLEAILRNRNKTDRSQTNSQFNQFSRVIIGGDNYFYTEANLANQWAQGFAYGGIGGVAGGIAAQGMQYDKGIVWDFKNKEFNIFKNCKDYNAFISAVYPEAKQDCSAQQANLYQIRKTMEIIK